jgi:hypothetical protein
MSSTPNRKLLGVERLIDRGCRLIPRGLDAKACVSSIFLLIVALDNPLTKKFSFLVLQDRRLTVAVLK